jgi:ribonucleoside-diphosphate reductase alpha chain
MKITRKFTTAGSDPFASVKWVTRSSKITNPDGSVVFEMKDAQVPETWSQLATDIMVSKYFRKAGVPQGGGPNGLPSPGVERAVKDLGPEKSAKQVIHRLAGCWRHWGETHNYFDTPADAQAFYDELCHMMVHQMCAPNSPQWFNTGLAWAYGINGPAQGHFVPDHKTGEVSLAEDAYTHPQPHACFIQSVSDDLVNEGGIMDLWVREARLFKYGSGTGTNFSNLRGDGEKLSGGGRSSGLMSWLRIGDRAASAIKSGGTTRRAAKMVCLDMDHPDIGDFIDWKVREEIKVQAMVEGLKLLKKHSPDVAKQCEELNLKLDYDFNGEAYQTVAGQNSNNSVRIPDEFFEALDKGAEWRTIFRTSKKAGKTYKSAELWEKIGQAAWRCADPGVQYDSTINAWHTCPSAGRINASNPCVTGDTLVATTTGLRRIADLVGGTAEVVNADGKPSFVDRIFKTGTKPIFELKTSAGYRVRLTGDHKVWTENRGDVPACELTVDDVVRLQPAGFGDDFVPEAFGEVLGAAMGDGCVTHQPGQDFMFVSMGADEGDVAEHLRAGIDSCKTWLGGDDQRSHRETSVLKTQTGLRVGTSVQAILDRMAMYAVLDRGSEHKQFTDAVFGLDRRSVAAMLRGLFTADGTVADYGEKSQYVSLDSTSLPLLRQVQLLLLSMGVKAKIYENRRALGQDSSMLPDGKGGQASYAVQQMHSLRISRSSRVAFEREVGFIPGSKKAAKLATLNQRVSAYADRLTDRVASLTPAGVEDVFDLTEPTTSHFVANGIVVHNCSEYMFLDNTACNLASLNVLKFYDPLSRSFDIERYEHGIDLWTIVLEISVLMAAFPSKEIAELSWKYRTLGLGYANLGAMLMQAGLAYDSDEGRAICAMLTAILTGRSYRMSALLAKEQGPFPGYPADKDNMLRVIRNHRHAAHGEARSSGKYENLKIRPVPTNHGLIEKQAAAGKMGLSNALKLLTRSTVAWDEALSLGEKHGYRNAQTTVIAPTGTIGLLMDCDTTGVEPDFALVKFKKLAGGGYFKIANESVKPALQALGYSDVQVRDMMAYLLGELSLSVLLPVGVKGAQPGETLAVFLKRKGLTDAHIKAIESQLPGAFELSFAFSAWALPADALQACGLDPAKAQADSSFNLLKALGFSEEQVDALNLKICGTATVEGSPHLKPEHLSVFDCANPCGKLGKRFIHPHGHIHMMAAAQPFISGAISKTINLPNSASVQDIKDCYRLSWELGLKANALYRDGCKLSQPLSATTDEAKKEAGKEAGKEDEGAKVGESAKTPVPVASKTASPAPVAAAASNNAGDDHAASADMLPPELKREVIHPRRRRLADTRRSITHKFNIAGHEGYLTVGLYEDGQPGELFITMSKEGSTVGGLMDSLGTATSVALQYGVPISSLVHKFSHQRFEPAGMTENRDIPMAKSLVDYIFRWMGMQFIPGYREEHSPVAKMQAEKAAAAHAIAEAANKLVADRMAMANPPGTTPLPESLQNRISSIGEPAGRITFTEPAPNASSFSTTTGSSGGSGGGAKNTTISGAVLVDNATKPSTAEMISKMSEDAQADAPACDVCGTITMRSGVCYKCLNCGNSMGCS